MSTVRIIPCLDFKDGRVVKGISFVNLRKIGDPVEMAKLYQAAGADELAFLDISATTEGRKTMIEVVRSVAQAITIPLTVGGGVSQLSDMQELLAAGATRVSLNSAAVCNPMLIKEASEQFGSSSLVVAIDVIQHPQYPMHWEVVTHGGQKSSGLDAVDWAKKVELLGAGQILLTSKDQDGRQNGYDLAVTKAISSAVNIPVIASGGAGQARDLLLAITEGGANAVLAASIFHNGTYSIRQIKEYLQQNQIPVIL